MKKKLNIGLIGHKFMGKAHSHALRDISMFFDPGVIPVMKVICGVEDDIVEVAEKYGWESCEKSWEKVVNNPEIDIIDIATPGITHKEIALAAVKNGKHVICEKPLAMTFKEAMEMYEAAEKSNVKHMVNFNYRRVPAVILANKLIDEGRLGKIYHFKAIYQQEWAADANVPFLWRFDKVMAGAGSMADKGSHIIDLARFLIGEIDEVAGTTEIFIKERSSLDRADVKNTVTTDDAAMFMARFKNGVLGLFETSRISVGHKNALFFEVNGSKGSVKFNLERLNELEVYFNEDAGEVRGFRNIMVTEPSHSYIKQWWPSGHILGWEHTFIHQYYEFLKAIVEDYKPSPSFYDGMKNQEAIEAVEKAALEKRWIKI
ncbi:MAG: Gfo/Idh/MocA family oxidoreductase [Clostridiales bacterium]|nr:Gfo/Idh/MocA family oxidoreductase [Clostridiales bacterium]